MPTPDIIVCERPMPALKIAALLAVLGVSAAVWRWYPFWYSYERLSFLFVAFAVLRWVNFSCFARIIAGDAGLTWKNPWPLSSVQVSWLEITDFYRGKRGRYFVVAGKTTLPLNVAGEWENELRGRVVDRAVRSASHGWWYRSSSLNAGELRRYYYSRWPLFLFPPYFLCWLPLMVYGGHFVKSFWWWPPTRADHSWMVSPTVWLMGGATTLLVHLWWRFWNALVHRGEAIDVTPETIHWYTHEGTGEAVWSDVLDLYRVRRHWWRTSCLETRQGLVDIEFSVMPRGKILQDLIRRYVRQNRAESDSIRIPPKL